MKKLKVGIKEYSFKSSFTAGHIQSLHPSVRKNFADFVEEVESPENGNLEVDFTSSYRSPEKQKELFNAGQTPTEISLHNFGFAVDLNVNGTNKAGNKVALRMASPSIDWQPIVTIAQKHSLTWGGNFTGYADRVHFQYSSAKKASQYLADYNSGQVDENNFVIV